VPVIASSTVSGERLSPSPARVAAAEAVTTLAADMIVAVLIAIVSVAPFSAGVGPLG